MKKLLGLFLLYFSLASTSFLNAQWVEKSYPYSGNSYLSSLKVFDSNCVVLTILQSIYISTNKGETFRRTNASGGNFVMVDGYNNSNLFYILNTTGNVSRELYASTDAGVNWVKKEIAINGSNVFSPTNGPQRIICFDSLISMAYALVNDSVSISAITYDKGASWNNVNLGIKLNKYGTLSNITSAFGDTLIVEYTNPNVSEMLSTYLISNNKGQTWTKIELPILSTMASVAWVNGTSFIAQATISTSELVFSRDRGKNIERGYSFFPAIYMDKIQHFTINGASKLIAINKGGTYYSNDYGKNWMKENDFFMSDISFSHSGFGACVASSDGNYDNRLLCFEGSFTGIEESLVQTEIEPFPNPCIDGRLVIGKISRNYQLIDLNGRVCLSNCGTELDVSGLKSGVYFLKIESFSGAKKIVVLNN